MDQKQFVKVVDNPLEKMIRIVAIDLAGIKLTDFEIKVLEFINNTTEFTSKKYNMLCDAFGVQKQTVRNTISSLKKKKMLAYDSYSGIYRLPPAINLNGNDVTLTITLKKK